MSERPVDIDDLVRSLCRRAGVDYESTAEIVITPTELIAYEFLRDANGRFYLDETREYAQRTLVKVRT